MIGKRRTFRLVASRCLSRDSKASAGGVSCQNGRTDATRHGLAMACGCVDGSLQVARPWGFLRRALLRDLAESRGLESSHLLEA